jgi:hypothetical protein
MKLRFSNAFRYTLIGSSCTAVALGLFTRLVTNFLGHVRPSWLELETAWYAALTGMVLGGTGGAIWGSIRKEPEDIPSLKS